jgi:hypothetical protein
MLINERVLYSDALAKYAAAFFRMSRSSVVRFNSAFMRLISFLSASTSSLIGDGDRCRACLSQTYRLLSEMPSRFATSTTPWPRSVTCLTASALNSAVYLVPLIFFTPLQFRHYHVSTEAGEVHFYNQIYLHRLNNAIESADATLKPVADDIETFLSALNIKSSQGVPVGPAASIVMSEAVLIDVDIFIRDHGMKHTRYVDDIRVFSNSTRELYKLLERLTLYLYENHRLTLAAEKTIVMGADDYVQQHLHNNYVEEKIQLLETLEIFNPYTNEYEELEFEVVADQAQQQEQLEDAIEKVMQYEHLDLGLARSVIRTARRNSIPILAKYLLQNFAFFVPAVNDVALYLKEVTSDELADELCPLLEELISSPSFDSELVRFWMEWYVAQYPVFMKSAKLHHFVFSGINVENQALAAITTKNVAWVRNHKTSVYNLGGWARRAVLNASRVLPSDERNHWLKLFIGNSPVVLDRWVAKWVLETAN